MCTEAIGLNTDLAVVIGKFEAINFSYDICGTTTKVGTGVHGLAPGDRVYGSVRGNFVIRGPGIFLQRTAATDNAEGMASIPIC
jgi:NADPH:quinone reductase-like Zn-dependent oxidoreductase